MNQLQPTKLVTKGKILLMMSAAFLGVGIYLFRHYQKAGAISRLDIVIAFITLGIVFSIIVVMGWWANRPETGGQDD